MKQPKFYWHIHYDTLLEPLIEPIKNRIKFIKNYAPQGEIKLRLKLIKPVKEKLPEELVKAGQEWCKTQQDFRKIEWKDFIRIHTKKEEHEYDTAERKYNIIIHKYLPQLKTLHKKECGCGYDFKRKTIFTKKNGFKK